MHLVDLILSLNETDWPASRLVNYKLGSDMTLTGLQNLHVKHFSL